MLSIPVWTSINYKSLMLKSRVKPNHIYPRFTLSYIICQI
nr:MAG TPA: hypothetical protein [Caudoviricetes sp.]